MLAARTTARRHGIFASTALGRVPRVRVGHGELRSAELPGRAEEGRRPAVGPGSVRQESADHEARRQVQTARGILVRRRRGA